MYALFPENILRLQTEMSYIIIYDPKFILQDLTGFFCTNPSKPLSRSSPKGEDN